MLNLMLSLAMHLTPTPLTATPTTLSLLDMTDVRDDVDQDAGEVGWPSYYRLQCRDAVSVACEDTTLRSVDAGECSDETLASEGRFAACDDDVIRDPSELPDYMGTLDDEDLTDDACEEY